MKPTNADGHPDAELVERRAGAKGNTLRQSTPRAQNRTNVSQALERVRQAAKVRKKERFTSLLHHVDVDFLREAFMALRRKAAPGADGVTWQDDATDLENNLKALHERVHGGAYRAQPSRRRYIPKPDGRQRPLVPVFRVPVFSSLRLAEEFGVCVPEDGISVPFLPDILIDQIISGPDMTVDEQAADRSDALRLRAAAVQLPETAY